MSVVGAPEVSPVPSVGCREPVVLYHDGDKEPSDDLPAEKRGVERGNLAGSLAVIIRQAPPKEEANNPHEDGDGNGDGCNHRGVGNRIPTGDTGCGLLGEPRAPVPESDDVGLLGPLNNAGTVDPGFDWSST